MIDLHTWTTPNGFKPIIMLEETGLPHRITPVDLTKNQQNSPEHLKLNPNGKIPALIDTLDDGKSVHVFESGAMLVYLAEKSGAFLPREGQARADALAWLMFQMSAVGPMLGQWGHFRGAKREDTYALDRYAAESERVLGVLDKRLGEVDHLAGEYSIADIATFPWVAALPRFGKSLDAFPHLARWVAAVGARPAVARAMAWKP
jgi:GST-like protein